QPQQPTGTTGAQPTPASGPPATTAASGATPSTQASPPPPATEAPPAPQPGPPSSVHATANTNSVTVSWSGVSGASSYRVIYAGGAVAGETSGTTLNVPGRAACTDYAFQVQTIDASGRVSSPSSSASARTGNTAPSASNGATGLKSGVAHHRVITTLASDPESNITQYKLVQIGFSASTFKFSWDAAAGTFDITPPAGNGGESYLTWEAVDSCGGVSAVVRETLDFVN
ncbi:MAG: hypothetical protein JWP11_2391, partial [Frankiales bacterium]|nr:hypothetical protein [Frankiales bacterium]